MQESFKNINEYHLVIYHSIRAIYESYGSSLSSHLEQQLSSVVYSIGEYIDDNPNNVNKQIILYHRRFYDIDLCNRYFSKNITKY